MEGLGAQTAELGVSQRRALKFVIALGVVLASSSASAAPTLWQRAREPRSARAERVLVRMERVFDGVAQAGGDSQMLEDFRAGTVLVAQMSGAAELSDARLLLLLSRALLGFDGERDSEARALVDRALGSLSESDAWLEPELRAVQALAARKNPLEARHLLTRALTSAWQPELRTELLRRRADAEMALFDLRASLRDARAARSFAPSAGERILGCFSLALALERNGDPPAAFAELRTARLLATSAQAAEEAAAGVGDAFVFRPLDVDYLAALRAMEAATSQDDIEQRIELYDRAVLAWSEYLRSAPREDRWIGAARTYQRECEAARRALAESLL